jgi:hypothetical protein
MPESVTPCQHRESKYERPLARRGQMLLLFLSAAFKRHKEIAAVWLDARDHCSVPCNAENAGSAKLWPKKPKQSGGNAQIARLFGGVSGEPANAP